MNDKVLAGFMYCTTSARRHDVVMALGSESYLTPTALAKKTDIAVNHISNLLRDLKNKNIVVCINEDVRKGKLYRLTEYGEQILPYLKGEKTIV